MTEDELICECCGIELDEDDLIEVDLRDWGHEYARVCSEECREELIGQYEDAHMWDYEDRMFDECDFADPGGRSALRAGNRIYPCPTCGRENQLSERDVQLHYQCDYCADLLERGGY